MKFTHNVWNKHNIKLNIKRFRVTVSAHHNRVLSQRIHTSQLFTTMWPLLGFRFQPGHPGSARKGPWRLMAVPRTGWHTESGASLLSRSITLNPPSQSHFPHRQRPGPVRLPSWRDAPQTHLRDRRPQIRRPEPLTVTAAVWTRHRCQSGGVIISLHEHWPVFSGSALITQAELTPTGQRFIRKDPLPWTSRFNAAYMYIWCFECAKWRAFSP